MPSVSRSLARRLRSTAATALLAVTPSSLALADPPEDMTLVALTAEDTPELDFPVAAVHAGDGSGRLFVLEQEGLIRIFDDGALLGTPFLDLTDEVLFTLGGELGLLGIAFHPDYESNGYFYVNYSRRAGVGRNVTVIERYEVSEGDANVADESSALLVLEQEQPYPNHNGGSIAFGPDGYLYAAFGDGGFQFDPQNRAQTVTSLLGKMIRIDVDAATADRAPAAGPRRGGAETCADVVNYGIPEGNPFAAADGVCDEIWAFGLRNPWKFSFDRVRNDIFIGDVGQGDREEVHFQPAASDGGENYGWSCREGTLVQNFNACLPMALTGPILEHPSNGDNCAVIGGYRYRGDGVGGLGGRYVFGDECSGRIWTAQLGPDGSPSGAPIDAPELWIDLPYYISAFGEDEDGELYLIRYSSNNQFTANQGVLYAIRSPSTIWTDGFETGDTAQWAETVIEAQPAAADADAQASAAATNAISAASTAAP